MLCFSNNDIRGLNMTENRNRVAAVQMNTGLDLNTNLRDAERLVAEAASQGAGLVVLPENFAFMGKKESDLHGLRESYGDGPLQSFLSRLAQQLGVWLVGGSIPMEAIDNSKIRAVCMVYNDQGEPVARYDKIHLFDVQIVETDERYLESASIEPGSDVVVVDSPFGKLGIAVCYDLRFPELFRQLIDRGAEVICLPAAFTHVTGKVHWKALLRARAIENLSYLIASAQSGLHQNGRQTFGHSMILDPWGRILERIEDGIGVISYDLDPEYQTTTRRYFPVLEHRRLRS